MLKTTEVVQTQVCSQTLRMQNCLAVVHELGGYYADHKLNN
jgi:hypothetical protein